jgi:hypothetical protein
MKFPETLSVCKLTHQPIKMSELQGVSWCSPLDCWSHRYPFPGGTSVFPCVLNALPKSEPPASRRLFCPVHYCIFNARVPNLCELSPCCSEGDIPINVTHVHSHISKFKFKLRRVGSPWAALPLILFLPLMLSTVVTSIEHAHQEENEAWHSGTQLYNPSTQEAGVRGIVSLRLDCTT